MSSSALRNYLQDILAHVPWWRWAVICILALTVFFLMRKKSSCYGAVALAASVFVGLFLLDTAVLNRIGIHWARISGIDLAAEYNRLLHGGERRHVEMLANMAVFVPLGFFLSEFLAALKRFGSWRRIGLVVLVSFGFSLCIECLQLVLRVGWFEVTDLVLNTVGAFVGASLSAVGRTVFGLFRKGEWTRAG